MTHAPKPPEPSPGFLLMTLGRSMRTEVEARLKQHGTSLRHFSALGHLSREPGLSYSELGRRAGVTAQSMQATLRQLEELGAVERRTLPGRGRTAELVVTPSGAELIATGHRTVREVEAAFLKTLDDEQRRSLTGILLSVLTGR
ncbi:MarR family transcriptional regulator [Kineosporia sp. J2-2]|uniref:MarR family transcriptional regulator n=1 Tax=Kineosporia corallincola TaxID=2835133 RepID=A0ABS5TMD9_9ACTN|nr:MarR family transcriptional regulator [Kineosporia corallincola]MBT0771223.1 MarR family transcriptional regulator [Kineosporia corallincola]